MVVAGDTNSYPQPTIDHLGGPSYIKQSWLANTLLSLGSRDTFQERHSTVRAFTHITKSGGSRFDQIWFRSCNGMHLDTVNAKIIWNWQHRTDHTPIICDFLSIILTIVDKRNSSAQPAWRKLVRDVTESTTKSII